MKIGFTCSAFDLLHPGHVVMLETCKKYCDYLKVGLHVDPSLDRVTKNKPIQSVYERYILLKGNKFVDEIIPYETENDLFNLISTQEMDIRFLGEDYVNKVVTGQDLCNTLGIQIVYLNRKHNYSSSGLRGRLL